jgi:hypothetical protein
MEHLFPLLGTHGNRLAKITEDERSKMRVVKDFDPGWLTAES